MDPQQQPQQGQPFQVQHINQQQSHHHDHHHNPPAPATQQQQQQFADLLHFANFRQRQQQQQQQQPANDNDDGVMQQLMILVRETQDTDNMVRSNSDVYQNFVIQLQTRSRIISGIEYAKSSNHYHASYNIEQFKRDLSTIEHALKQKGNELNCIRRQLISSQSNIFERLMKIQDKILFEYLPRWHHEQQLMNNGAHEETIDLDTIQSWIEKIFEIIWKIKNQVKALQLTLIDKRNVPFNTKELEDFVARINKALDKLISNAFVVEKQPPQVMKTNTRFTSTVRFLCGKKLNVQMINPTVKALILSEQNARAVIQYHKQLIENSWSSLDGPWPQFLSERQQFATQPVANHHQHHHQQQQQQPPPQPPPPSGHVQANDAMMTQATAEIPMDQQPQQQQQPQQHLLYNNPTTTTNLNDNNNLMMASPDQSMSTIDDKSPLQQQFFQQQQQHQHQQQFQPSHQHLQQQQQQQHQITIINQQTAAITNNMTTLQQYGSITEIGYNPDMPVNSKDFECSGEILNNSNILEYHEASGQMISHFKNMQLKKIKRTEKKGTESVMDEKFILLFFTEFRIADDSFCSYDMKTSSSSRVKRGDLLFHILAFSLPVVVIVHGNQEPHAWATVTWHNAFATPDEVLYSVPDRVPWRDLGNVLSEKFRSAAGRGLSQQNMRFLASKVARNNNLADNDDTLITWNQFSKEPLPERSFTFWEWFHSILKLTKDHLSPLWKAERVYGFIDKKGCVDLLLGSAYTEPAQIGTFLLRFSETELGAITIAWVSSSSSSMEPSLNDCVQISQRLSPTNTSTNVVMHLQPFAAKDLNTRSLADRVRDLKDLVTLFPNIPKDEAFEAYYTPINSAPKSSEGYVRSLLVTTLAKNYPVSNNAGSHTESSVTPNSVAFSSPEGYYPENISMSDVNESNYSPYEPCGADYNY